MKSKKSRGQNHQQLLKHQPWHQQQHQLQLGQSTSSQKKSSSKSSRRRSSQSQAREPLPVIYEHWADDENDDISEDPSKIPDLEMNHHSLGDDSRNSIPHEGFDSSDEEDSDDELKFSQSASQNILPPSFVHQQSARPSQTQLLHPNYPTPISHVSPQLKVISRDSRPVSSSNAPSLQFTSLSKIPMAKLKSLKSAPSTLTPSFVSVNNASSSVTSYPTSSHTVFSLSSSLSGVAARPRKTSSLDTFSSSAAAKSVRFKSSSTSATSTSLSSSDCIVAACVLSILVCACIGMMVIVARIVSPGGYELVASTIFGSKVLKKVPASAIDGAAKIPADESFINAHTQRIRDQQEQQQYQLAFHQQQQVNMKQNRAHAFALYLAQQKAEGHNPSANMNYGGKGGRRPKFRNPTYAEVVAQRQRRQQQYRASTFTHPNRPTAPPLEVDAVFTYINHTDPEWYSSLIARTDIRVDSDRFNRYRDWGELRYSMRSLYQNAPWIRNFIVVVASHSQIPRWLNSQHPRVRIVLHSEFIPNIHQSTATSSTKQNPTAGKLSTQMQKSTSTSPAQLQQLLHQIVDKQPPLSPLPTFNSLVIESALHRISGLSDHFLYVNNDVFLNSPTPQALFGDEHTYVKFQDWTIMRDRQTPEFCYRWLSFDVQAWPSDKIKRECSKSHVNFFWDRIISHRLWKTPINYWFAHIPHFFHRKALFMVEARMEKLLKISRLNRVRDPASDISSMLQYESLLQMASKLVNSQYAVNAKIQMRTTYQQSRQKKVIRHGQHNQLSSNDDQDPSSASSSINELNFHRNPSQMELAQIRRSIQIVSMEHMNKLAEMNKLPAYYSFMITNNQDILNANATTASALTFRYLEKDWYWWVFTKLQSRGQFVGIEDDFRSPSESMTRFHQCRLRLLLHLSWPQPAPWELWQDEEVRLSQIDEQSSVDVPKVLASIDNKEDLHLFFEKQCGSSFFH